VKEIKLSGVKPETRRAAIVFFIGLTSASTVTTDTSNASVPADPKTAPKK
jgi:hypothetical protein